MPYRLMSDERLSQDEAAALVPAIRDRYTEAMRLRDENDGMHNMHGTCAAIQHTYNTVRTFAMHGSGRRPSVDSDSFTRHQLKRMRWAAANRRWPTVQEFPTWDPDAETEDET